MTIYGVIGILVLLYAIFSIVTYFIATKDFSKREFPSLDVKKKWRMRIYFIPFGPLWYLCKNKQGY